MGTLEHDTFGMRRVAETDP